MRSDDVDVLQELVNAATTWRNQALTKGVEMDVLMTRINGEIVFLRWDANLVLWDIRTAQSTITAKYIKDDENAANSRWEIVAQ